MSQNTVAVSKKDKTQNCFNHLFPYNFNQLSENEKSIADVKVSESLVASLSAEGKKERKNINFICMLIYGITHVRYIKTHYF